MELSEKSFQILDTLDRREIFNQRQLAEHSGVSLSQVNYLLRLFVMTERLIQPLSENLRLSVKL